MSFDAGRRNKAMKSVQRDILAFVGFSLFLLVQILGFHSCMDLEGIPGVGEGERERYILATVIAHVLVFVCASIIWQRRTSPPLARPRLFAALTAITGCTGFVLLWLSAGLLPGVEPTTVTTAMSTAVTAPDTLASPVFLRLSFILGASLIGATMALCSLYWLQRLTLLSYRGSYFYLLCGHAVATCLCAAVLLVLPGLGAFVTPLCLVLSSICLALGTAPLPPTAQTPTLAFANLTPPLPDNVQPPASLGAQARGITALLWRGVLSVCIFALIGGLVSRLSGQTVTEPQSLQGFMLAVSACVLMVMSIPAIITRKPLKLESSYFIALPLSVLSLLVVPSLVSPLPAGMNGVLAATGYMLVGIILYCTIAEVSRFTAIPAAPLLAVCGSLTLCCYLLGLLLARPIARYLPESLTGPLIIGLGLLYLIVLGIVSLLEHSAFSPPRHPTELAPRPGAKRGDGESVTSMSDRTSPVTAKALTQAPDGSSRHDSSSAQLIENPALSAREHEILLLLARGRTLPRIGESLYLSTSAVKYHTQAIYRKLGVHSRKELLRALCTVNVPTYALNLINYDMLTARERQVFGMLAAGKPTNAIAEALDLSPNTVKTHIKRVYQKLDIHSKQELIDLMNEGDDIVHPNE
ncbi:MAG: LuxR C-terminal-related transcriptional regulator [Coriobacteriales bacterium]|jgi:DNA-binding CsgD family transcriptional regulator|nr:LuxR C-terminal-related transcriptional regulator [Coriobacteriales bacterium]